MGNIFFDTVGLAGATSDPATGSAGELYYNLANNVPTVKTNVGWQQVLLRGNALTNALIVSPIESYTYVDLPNNPINFDVKTQAVLEAGVWQNFTVNIRGDASTTLNSLLSVGQVVTISLIANQTIYSPAGGVYQTAMTIDGTSVTPKWSGGTAPTSSTYNTYDIYTYTIQKTANATFRVFASKTNWGT